MASYSHPVTIVDGPAGVSAAVALKDRGLRPLLLERDTHVAASWRNRYDRLRLNTGRQFSHVPGRRYPKGTPTFPTRDQVVAHLDRHAHEEGIELRLETAVDGLEQRDGGWVLQTVGGPIETRQVVIATGYEHSPLIPDWEGREGFTGTVIHSAEYRNPASFQGRSVLVVGSGCSGMEIAHDLAGGGAAKVWLSMDPAEHHAARRAGGPARRCDRDPALPRSGPARRRDRPVLGVSRTSAISPSSGCRPRSKGSLPVTAGLASPRSSTPR